MEAVVLDLFGTLIDAPTAEERRNAAIRLAGAARADADDVERYLIDSWQPRHDGTLTNVEAVADDLVRAVVAEPSRTTGVAEELTKLGRERLRQGDPSVLDTLTTLRLAGARIAVLSDAEPEVGLAARRARPAGRCRRVQLSLRCDQAG